jgi:futalosine hydrolase
MKILIVSATTFEIQPLFGLLNFNSHSEENLFSTTYNQLSIDVLITGVGMVATTYHTTKALLKKKYDIAINAGICGSFNNNLQIGSVVNIYEDCFSELGAEDGDNFLTLKELNLPGNTIITNTDSFDNEAIEQLPKVNGITVNTTHGNETSIDNVFQKFHPITESMEGAGFMFVCNEEKVPYVQMRAVSNFVERRNKNNWNIPLAIENLNGKVWEVLNGFSNSHPNP